MQVGKNFAACKNKNIRVGCRDYENLFFQIVIHYSCYIYRYFSFTPTISFLKRSIFYKLNVIS